MSTLNLKEKLLHELEVNLWEGWVYFGKGKGADLFESEKVIWFRNQLPTIPYNAVIKFQETDNTDHQIDEIIRKCSEDGRELMWVVGPSSEPKDLPERLKERGLFEAELITGMGRTLSDLPDIPDTPHGIEILKVTEAQAQQEFIEFATWRWSIPSEYHDVYRDIIAPFGFGRPGSKFSAWQAWMDGKPVSKVGVSRSENSIGIYAVATRPEARRMGLAKLLTLHVLHEMRREGHEIAVLHSTPMAESLYASIGFEKLANLYLYAKTDMHI